MQMRKDLFPKIKKISKYDLIFHLSQISTPITHGFTPQLYIFWVANQSRCRSRSESFFSERSLLTDVYVMCSIVVEAVVTRLFKSALGLLHHLPPQPFLQT